MGVCINNIIDKIVPGDWGKEDTDNSGVRVIRTTNFTNVGKIDFSNIVTRIITDKKIRERQLIKGDIIIEKSGGSPNQPVGRVVYFDEDDNGEPILCNNFTSVIRCKSNVNSRYIFYYLYLNWCKGGTRKYQNKTTGILNLKLEKYLDDIVIELPTLEEQNRIVSLLDKADEIRVKKKLANDKLDEFLKSTFISMFGDPKTNSKCLPLVKIKDLCTVQTGSTPKRDVESYYKDATIPWVKTGEVINQYIYGAEERISEKAIKETNCKLFPKDTILVAMYGQGLTRGRVGMLKIEASTNQACAAILPSEKINQEYLYNQLKIQYQTLRDYGRGGNQPNLNLDIVKNFEITIPPIEDQNKFAQIVEHVEAQKQKNELVIEQMNNLFNSLSQRAFKGEL